MTKFASEYLDTKNYYYTVYLYNDSLYQKYMYNYFIRFIALALYYNLDLQLISIFFVIVIIITIIMVIIIIYYPQSVLAPNCSNDSSNHNHSFSLLWYENSHYSDVKKSGGWPPFSQLLSVIMYIVHTIVEKPQNHTPKLLWNYIHVYAITTSYICIKQNPNFQKCISTL